jgi:hypothetical protein
MAVKNDIVYLCYDAGGIRIINCSDKQNIKETGRYSNPAMNNKARAYNNVVLNDSLLYVAVDYAGMEILNIKDTSNIALVSWWNPWGTANWFASRGHANEIQFDLNSKLVFMATGKSDINVVNVANPAAPDSVTIYGGINNGMGTWGLGLYQNKIYAGYIYVPLCIPFCSNWGGVKEITWNIPTAVQENSLNNFSFYPNPSENIIQLNSSEGNLKIHNINGELILSRSVQRNETVDLSLLASGFYIITFINNEGEIVSTQKLLKN